MLDFADVVAINKFEREAPRTRCGPSSAQYRSATRQSPMPRRRHCRSSARSPHGSTTTGVTALYQALRDALASKGLAVANSSLHPSSGKVAEPHAADHSAGTRRATWPRSSNTMRAYHAVNAAHCAPCATSPRSAPTRACSSRSGRCPPVALADLAIRSSEGEPASRELLVEFARRREAVCAGDELVDESAAEVRHRSSERRSRAPGVPRVALPAVRRRGRACCAGCASENLPGRFPFTAGVFAFKRAERGPGPHVRRRGRPGRTNRRFHMLSEGQPADAPVDRLRLGDALRRDPDEPPDIYGKVGDIGVSRRHARRHEEALRRVRPLRPQHLGVA